MMEDFSNILACYRSGQMSEKQWQEHLKDSRFARWVDHATKIPTAEQAVKDGGK